MRAVWFRGFVLGAAASLALIMLFLNFAFEAAGSTPDAESCGFLAGNLLSLALLYPAAAAFVSFRFSRTLLRRVPQDGQAILRAGGAVGLIGALIYFILG